MESASFESAHHLTALNDEMQSFRKPGFGTISAHRNPCGLIENKESLGAGRITPDLHIKGQFLGT